MSSDTTQKHECQKHGPFTTRALVSGGLVLSLRRCPACQREEEDAREAAAEDKARREHEHALLRQSGIAGRYVECTFENYKATKKPQREVLSACKAFVGDDFHADRGGGLWLCGTPGTGKTHLGASMVTAVIKEHGLPACIASAREIVRRVRATWRHREGEGEEEVIEHFAGVALLVLDEADFGSDGGQATLFDVLDRRYALRRPTVLLSNLNPPMLRDSLGDRAFDRLREGAHLLVLDWPSHRGTA